MKAAVLTQFGANPRYENFPDPIPADDEELIDVKAVALENVNRMMASGTHYSSRQFFPAFPAIIGHTGIGTTREGKLVGFSKIKPPYGAFAEKVVAPKSQLIPVPEGIDPAMAAALPPSILTSLLPLKYTAKLQPGETVLVNGATGVSGRIAIQVAKMLGAGRVVGTGRNEASLKSLHRFGADGVIDLKHDEENISASFIKEGSYDIVLDYIWGKPAELLMKTFVPKELGFTKKRIRYIQIGEKAGPAIALSGESLRTSGLEIHGLGNIPPQAIPESLNQVWQWIGENKISADIERIPLSEIETAWQRNDFEGKRLVIVP